MVRSLVQTFGQPFPGDPTFKAFPSPGVIAAVPLDDFAASVSLGYRAPYVHALASRVACDGYDLEALRHSRLPSTELRDELRAIKGVGPYAAATLSMVLGRYDQLAVDTELRQFVSQTYFGGSSVPDADAIAVYDDWGPWRYLAYWFDLTSR
jgi:3-methyladenine DNA glycosylase/8-oxoguanine DNA glycosylase